MLPREAIASLATSFGQRVASHERLDTRTMSATWLAGKSSATRRSPIEAAPLGDVPWLGPVFAFGFEPKQLRSARAFGHGARTGAAQFGFFGSPLHRRRAHLNLPTSFAIRKWFRIETCIGGLGMVKYFSHCHDPRYSL